MATITKGEKTLNAALQWVAANPKAWKRLQHKCVKAAKRKRVFSVRRFCEDLRWDGRREGEDVGGYKLPNAITPVLARFVVHNHPRVDLYMRVSKSVCDQAVSAYLEKIGNEAV